MSDRVRLAAIAAVGLPALALVVAAIVLLLGRGNENAPIIITPPATPGPAAAVSAASASAVAPTATPSEIWVHISGRVANPGLYPMQPGQRVADVVLRAGGVLPDGDVSGLNLARRLTDEAQYHIPALGAANSGVPSSAPGSAAGYSGNAASSNPPSPGNPPPPGNPAVSGSAAPSSGGGASGGGVSSGGPVNLNRAGAAELETLPGIGPVLAAAILRYRQDNGPFQTIDALENVPGIGPKTLQNLRPLITIAP